MSPPVIDPDHEYIEHVFNAIGLFFGRIGSILALLSHLFQVQFREYKAQYEISAG